MTVYDCDLMKRAWDMMSDWVGIELVWWPDFEGDDYTITKQNEAACLLQQLIAEYEGLV